MAPSFDFADVRDLLGPGLAPPRTASDLRTAAEAAHTRALAFAGSARDRFLAGLQALEQQGYAGPAERARAAFCRGFADPDQVACPAEIGSALMALARLDQAPARAACLALAELLMETLKTAAE